MLRYINAYLLRSAAAHVVVFAVNGGATAGVNFREIRRAVFSVVANGPDAGAGLHTSLVAVGIVGGGCYKRFHNFSISKRTLSEDVLASIVIIDMLMIFGT